MSTQPAEQPQNLVLRSPVDVAASVPYMLGFVPKQSVVILFFDDRRCHITTSRVDFPDREALVDDFLDVVSDSCAHALRLGADRAQVVLYPPTDLADGVGSTFMDPLEAVIDASGIGLLALGAVVQGEWFDFGSPPSQQNPSVLSQSGVGATCQWVARGVSYLSDRETLAGTVSGEQTLVAERIAMLLAKASSDDNWGDLWPRTSRAADRRVIEDAIHEYLMQAGATARSESLDVSNLRKTEPVVLPNDSEIVGWAIALNDRRIREPLLWRLSAGYRDDSPHVVTALARAQDAIVCLVRNVPDEIVSALASCAAALAWQRGSGALAVLAAQRGLKAESRNVLSQLVLRACEQGLPPKVWVEMLQSMTLRELRSGRTIAYTPEDYAIRNALRRVRDCPG